MRPPTIQNCSRFSLMSARSIKQILQESLFFFSKLSICPISIIHNVLQTDISPLETTSKLSGSLWIAVRVKYTQAEFLGLCQSAFQSVANVAHNSGKSLRSRSLPAKKTRPTLVWLRLLEFVGICVTLNLKESTAHGGLQGKNPLPSPLKTSLINVCNFTQ